MSHRNKFVSEVAPILKYRCMLLMLSFTLLTANQCFASISVGTLDKQSAMEKYGITMHASSNGDAGIKVWLEFKKEGWLEKLSYVELVMNNPEGKHIISAKLQPNPMNHRQPEDVTTVAFSAAAEQLKNCKFLVVCYNSSEGDVGYFLDVKAFLDMQAPVTDK